jgi:predicted MFS family arabinose efflux permease
VTLQRSPAPLFATVAGMAVASNYYVQPLLPDIGREFNLARASAGLLVTVSQLAYLVGLLVFVPLGDFIDRRRLVAALIAATAGALGGAALAPGVGWLLVTVALFGASSVVAQVLVALVADVASPLERGRSVSRVMAGILLGVLLARTAAGLIGAVGGWRLVYALSAVGLAALGVALLRSMPRDVTPRHRGYFGLMTSIVSLLRTQALLRLRATYGALTFGAFSALWATLALMLSAPPYEYGEATIGAFGLAAALGVVAALAGGRWFDAGHAVGATGAGLASGVVGFAFLDAGGHALWALISGVVLVDFGGQLVQTASQGKIYQIEGGVRSRLTTAYMGTRFVGGVAGSAAGVAAYASGGWPAACAIGGFLYLVGLALWLVESRLGRVDHQPLSA